MDGTGPDEPNEPNKKANAVIAYRAADDDSPSKRKYAAHMLGGMIYSAVLVLQVIVIWAIWRVRSRSGLETSNWTGPALATAVGCFLLWLPFYRAWYSGRRALLLGMLIGVPCGLVGALFRPVTRPGHRPAPLAAAARSSTFRGSLIATSS